MVIALLFVFLLLAISVALRNWLSLLQWLYIPASVVAGTIGLAIMQLTPWAGSLDAVASTLRTWPGWLIAVVFAGMLLERKPAPLLQSLSRVGRQGLMVWIIVLGQTAIGLTVTWLLIQPFYDVRNSFGTLIETGFAGGHGTAAAMGQVYEHPSVGLDGGLDLGMLMATLGLIVGIISGIGWINVGVRAGWTTGQSNSTGPKPLPRTPQPIGYAKVSGSTIDPLLLQVLWLGLAFGTGLALQSTVGWAAGSLQQWLQFGTDAGSADPLLAGHMSISSVVATFPLFIYTLFGGLIVRQLLRLLHCQSLIDTETIGRLTASAMDLLVVAAISTLSLSAVATFLMPLLLLAAFGVIWSSFCLIVVGRWLLPRDHWFELGLINYGMSTGTTATGFVLLRMVDPKLDSGAAEDYALAAPLSSPFIGGGILTVGLPLLVLERFPIGLIALAVGGVVLAMIVLGSRWNDPRYSPN